MKKLFAAALLSTIVVAPAFAADSGGYVGVTVGRAKVDTISGTTTTKDTDTIGSILAGYQYNKNLGVEVFYSGAGKLEGTCGAGCRYSAKGDAVGINAVGTAPLSDAFSLYAKLGYASTKTDFSINVAGTGVTGERHGAVTGGVGGQYNVTKEVGIRFGWDSYELALNSNGSRDTGKSNVWSMGVVFKF